MVGLAVGLVATDVRVADGVAVGDGVADFVEAPDVDATRVAVVGDGAAAGVAAEQPVNASVRAEAVTSEARATRSAGRASGGEQALREGTGSR